MRPRIGLGEKCDARCLGRAWIPAPPQHGQNLRRGALYAVLRQHRVVRIVAGSSNREKNYGRDRPDNSVLAEVEVREDKESAKEEVEVREDIDAVTKAAVEAKLTEADKFDGTTDKVVSKCPSCALGKDGKSEQALEVAGYKLHFCSEDCKTGFEKDTTKAILALKIPED